MSDNSVFDRDYLSTDAPQTVSNVNRIVGGVGLWLMHLVKITLLAYTAYHGIHAASLYADSRLALLFQAIGFITGEIVLLAIYVAYLNKSLNGDLQKLAAAAVYVVLLVIAGAAVVIDSRIALTGIESLPALGRAYFDWILPVVPIIAGVGAAVIHILDAENRAEQQQLAEQREQQRSLHQLRHATDIARQRTELQVASRIANTQLGSQLYLAEQYAKMVQDPTVLRQLHEQATRNLPGLLHAAGIHIQQFNAENTPLPDLAPNDAPWTLTRLLRHWRLALDDITEMADIFGWTTPRIMWDDLTTRAPGSSYSIPAGLTFEQFARIIPPALAQPVPVVAARFHGPNGHTANGSHPD